MSGPTRVDSQRDVQPIHSDRCPWDGVHWSKCQQLAKSAPTGSDPNAMDQAPLLVQPNRPWHSDRSPWHPVAPRSDRAPLTRDPVTKSSPTRPANLHPLSSTLPISRPRVEDS